MIGKSLARSARESTTRTERGQQLYAERAEEFRFEAKLGVWLVPSGSDLTSVYEVTLGLHPSCECKDFDYNGDLHHFCCKHIYATAAADADLAEEQEDPLRLAILREAENRYRNELMGDEERMILQDRIERLRRAL